MAKASMKEISLPKEIIVSDETIATALDYVDPAERYVLAATVQEFNIDALVRFDSPRYTKKPVEYLSSSVLAVSLAQVAHVLIEFTVEQGYFPYQSLLTTEYLTTLRENHELYFVDLRMQFHKRHPPEDYRLMMQVNRSRRIDSLSFFSLTFSIGDSVKGSFTTLVPLLSERTHGE